MATVQALALGLNALVFNPARTSSAVYGQLNLDPANELLITKIVIPGEFADAMQGSAFWKTTSTALFTIPENIIDVFDGGGFHPHLTVLPDAPAGQTITLPAPSERSGMLDLHFPDAVFLGLKHYWGVH